MRIPDHVWRVNCEFRSKDPIANELLYGVFVDLGISPQDIVEKTARGFCRFEIFSANQSDAKRTLNCLSASGLRGIKVTLDQVRTSDWQDLWKKGIKPFALTKTIEIIPRWTGKTVGKTKKFPIFIDTNLAFGTGLHETTQFMASIIESQKGSFRSFIDVGTGSGILVIVARYCGAREITALDIDPQSIKVARENFAANRVVGVRAFVQDFAVWKDRKVYDFVAANLVTHDLVEFGQRLARKVKPGGFLAVSGISLKNLSVLQKAFLKLSLQKIKILRGKAWSAVLYRKS